MMKFGWAGKVLPAGHNAGQVIIKFSFDVQIIFFKKLSVISFVLILYCFVKLFIKVPEKIEILFLTF